MLSPSPALFISYTYISLFIIYYQIVLSLVVNIDFAIFSGTRIVCIPRLKCIMENIDFSDMYSADNSKKSNDSDCKSQHNRHEQTEYSSKSNYVILTDCNLLFSDFKHIEYRTKYLIVYEFTVMQKKFFTY